MQKVAFSPVPRKFINKIYSREYAEADEKRWGGGGISGSKNEK